MPQPTHTIIIDIVANIVEFCARPTNTIYTLASSCELLWLQVLDGAATAGARLLVHLLRAVRQRLEKAVAAHLRSGEQRHPASGQRCSRGGASAASTGRGGRSSFVLGSADRMPSAVTANCASPGPRPLERAARWTPSHHSRLTCTLHMCAHASPSAGASPLVPSTSLARMLTWLMSTTTHGARGARHG